MNFNYLHPETI